MANKPLRRREYQEDLGRRYPLNRSMGLEDRVFIYSRENRTYTSNKI
jgi:hypothetical protein